MQELKYRRVRDVKKPTRAHEGDAGIDFYVPNDSSCLLLYPGESVLIPSGICVNVPKGWMLLMENKSGVGSRLKLTRLACVIDHGYQGEVHINLVNVGQKPVDIRPGDKIIQGVMLPVGLHTPTECEDPWEGEEMARGAAGFGSTGAK